jgi:hypothetical protein
MATSRPVTVPDFVAVVGVDVVLAALDRHQPVPHALFVEPATKTTPEPESKTHERPNPMPTTEPTYRVLRYFTDEALRASIDGTAGRSGFGPDVAAVLLRVPAEWRQSIEAAVAQATIKTVMRATQSGYVCEDVPIGDIVAARARLVDNFLTGWRPERMETLVSDSHETAQEEGK